MANPYRAFRQLERLVFRGVPEQPEPLWLRDGNAHVPERLTGKSQLGGALPFGVLKGAKAVGTIVYRFATEEIEYVVNRTEPLPACTEKP